MRSTRKNQHQRLSANTKVLSIWISSIVGILVFAGVIGIASFDALQKLVPSAQTADDLFNENDKPVFYRGELLTDPASGSGEGLMLSLSDLQSSIDPNIYYEEESGSVVMTAQDKVLHLKTDQLTAMMNSEPLTLHFPVQIIEDNVYVPIEPLISFYGLEIRESTETGAVLIWKEEDLIKWGSAVTRFDTDHVPLRIEASIKSPVAAKLKPGQKVMILEETDDGWYLVQLENGYCGYALKSGIRMERIEKIPEIRTDNPVIPWNPIGGKINLTWEAVYNVKPNPKNIGEMPGLNVISPTWFDLKKDDQGEFFVYNNHADAEYVKWAHERGYQVWALFSNSFDPDLTHEMLSKYGTRMSIIRELVSFAQLYKLQGINIDFENVYLKDKDLLTQFIRELTPILHEQGLVVSMDVTIRGGSEMWSLFYDRKELAKVIDYMIVMTYDEHWSSSPIAGSVASLPWVEKGITDIMTEDDVPASKLILGVPFYTRIWTEEILEDGTVNVSSRAVSMNVVKDLIDEHDLEPIYDSETGQHYVEYTEDGKLNKIWLEDSTSMKSRAELVKKLDLAGIASWRRGFESEEIWPVIQETLEARP